MTGRRPLPAALAAPLAADPPADEEQFRRQVGRRLTLYRAWHNLSQAEVARAAGVGRGFVGAAERGAVRLDAWRLRLVAHVLGTDLGSLLGDGGPPSETSGGG
jgi:transcriptional regulator with XRE-family HTH domain